MPHCCQNLREQGVSGSFYEGFNPQILLDVLEEGFDGNIMIGGG